MPEPINRQTRSRDSRPGQGLRPVVLRELSDLETLVRRLLVEKKDTTPAAARAPQRQAVTENVAETILQRIRDISEMTRNIRA